jgi:glycosidase
MVGLALALLSGACAPRTEPVAEVPRADAPAASTPAPAWNLGWARGAVFYQVFVRSFQDSDGDGVGDLKGLISRLDYIRDLGAEGIWLMPVFESPSYHGYDVVDYETIDREYGTNADFEALCREAGKRGIRVIVDLVVNHSGRAHPWFSDPSKKDWYVWRSDDPGWTQPWGGGPTWHRGKYGYFYGVFWDGMPDLNWRNPAVGAEMARVARLWLDRGAGGFRLDATRHLVEDGPGAGQSDTKETHRYLGEFAAAVRAHRPDALLVGENWTTTDNIAPYFDELPMNFDFPLASAIVDGVRAQSPDKIAFALKDVGMTYPDTAMDAPFLTNHDMIRVATELGGDVRKLKNAAAILFTVRGTPFVYYGEEIGLKNGPGRADEEKRTPMPWAPLAPGRGFTTGTPWHPFQDAVDADGSLLATYKAWIKLRREHPALRDGSLKVVEGEGAVLVYEREAPAEKLRIVHDLDGPETPCPDWACGVAGAQVVATLGDSKVYRLP